ncbi:hypothetical protein JX266_011471 [Neoarthrinium moseri]|nr:hypothetical protein JX266_011471 [Neoarthrinium moseri]
MATVLGKRKSRSAAAAEPAVSEEEAQAIFRRHFEAQFAPLPDSKPGKSSASADDDSEEEEDDDRADSILSLSEDEEADGDEWDGLSESDETPEAAAVEVEVIDHTKPSTANPLAAALSKREAKAYLSSRVPTSLASSASAASKAKAKPTPTEEDSADLLKNDLALQRLLSESHLFNPSKVSSSLIGTSVDTTAHAGRNRHLATDLRLAALGSKASIYKQAKMPMAHRKGIEGAAAARESKRRREAKENGIILERPAAAKVKKGDRRLGSRDRAVDAPAVGKLRNGMLRLSKRDVEEIQGSGGGGRGGKMKRRRR